MITAWKKGMSKEKADVMSKEFNASALLRERLKTLLQEKIESKRTKAVLENSYENPNWAYLQADAVGYERALKEVISMIS